MFFVIIARNTSLSHSHKIFVKVRSEITRVYLCKGETQYIKCSKSLSGAVTTTPHEKTSPDSKTCDTRQENKHTDRLTDTGHDAKPPDVKTLNIKNTYDVKTPNVKNTQNVKNTYDVKTQNVKNTHDKPPIVKMHDVLNCETKTTEQECARETEDREEVMEKFDVNGE